MLKVSDLAVARGGVPVLEGLSFEVPAGAALVLRGPNGVGKTTLLRTLAGLQPALTGTVEGAGEDAAYASGTDWLGKQPNLVMMRTFSKIYGMAGMRLGYAVGSPEKIKARSNSTLLSA